MGPALELFPAFVVGESVFDGDPLRGVLVPLAFVVFEERQGCAWSQLAGLGQSSAPVIFAQSEVAVVEEDVDQVEVVEASADSGSAGGSGVVHAARPQCIRPQSAARWSAMTVAFIVFCFFLPETNARRPPRPAAGRRT